MAISDRIAVMSRGRIEQVGTAAELYRRPASSFVATFIGRSNLVPCRVGAIDAGGAMVELLGGSHRLADVPLTLHGGAARTAVIRPESLRLVPAGSGGIDATVTSRVYLGDKVDYVVDAGGTALEIAHADPRDDADHPPGSRVGVQLPVRGIHLIEGEPT